MTENENKTPDQQPHIEQPAVAPVATPPASTDAAAPAEATNTVPAGTNSPVAPIIKTPMQKKGKKISPLVFGVGCVFFIALFVGGIFAALFYGVQNPGALASVGMNAKSAKTLLMIIAGVFFGGMFFISFAFLGLNGYRLSKAKSGPKAKFIIGMVFSFLFLTLSIGLGAGAILKVKNINTEDVATDTLVIPYVTIYDMNAKEPLQKWTNEKGITLVAPVEIKFKINKDIYNAVMGQKIGVNTIANIQLSCGNGANTDDPQMIAGQALMEGKSDWFDAPCLYTKKGDYKIELVYEVIEKTTLQKVKQTIEAGFVKVVAEIKLTNDGQTLKLNDLKTKLLGGDTPARIVFDAKQVFSDLGLKETRVIWDLDNDGIEEKTKENKAFFSFNFSEGKQYTVTYRFPGNSVYPNYVYMFPLWILQSDVPICTISSEKNDDGGYTFNGSWPNGGTDIESLRFEVYDLTKELVVQSVPVQNPQFNYTFTDNDQYVVRLVYNTLEKKKGFCESDIINALSATYNIKTTLSWKKPGAITYSSFATSGTMTVNGSSLVASEAPFDLQLRIDGTTPSLPKDATVTVLLNDQAMEAVKSNIYTARVYGPKPQIVKIFIDDKKGNTAEKVWNITFNQDVLIGALKADKVTGTDPLTVSFDASTITATTEGDEIVYYTWDFGDGQNKKNVTQAKLPHTYSFNTATSEGVYKPSVTVQTKKGHTKLFPLETPIAVTRKSTQVSISSPSHPTQVASMGDIVNFTMQTDGYVTSIAWDFGDGSTTTQCDYRACAETKHAFTSTGTFSVRTIVQYQGLPESTNTIKIKVE